MKKVDGYYLYQVGAALQKLHELKGNFSDNDTRGTEYQEAFYDLKYARPVLVAFLNHDSFRLKTCVQKGKDLLAAIDVLAKKIENDAEKNKLLAFGDVLPVYNALESFEAVLSSEFALLDLYVITKKGGYDISELMTNGRVCFPKDLSRKVPECLPDIEAGTKCIAVSLPTAAGFHLHRANESVLHRYWDTVTNGSSRPSTGNMGDYIHQLEQRKAGDEHVRSALKDLKNLHRNPLVHPEHSLESVEEAIALMDHIKAVIFHMLKAIPIQQEHESIANLVAALTAPVDFAALQQANSDTDLSNVG